MAKKFPTQSQLATALGVSQGQVSRYLKAGCPRDLEAARAWQVANVDPAQRAGKTSRTTPSFAHERALLTAAQRRREELKLRHEAGELVPVAGVSMILAARAQSVRDKLRGIRTKMRTRFDLPADAMQALEELHHEALVELSEERMPPELLRQLETLGADDDA